MYHLFSPVVEKITGRISHCLDIYLPEAEARITGGSVHPSPSGLTVLTGSVAGCGLLLKIKVLGRVRYKRGVGTEEHTGPTAAPGEHEGFGLRCKENGKQHRAYDWILVGPMSLLLRCKFHTVSVTVKQDVKHTGRYWCWKAEGLSCEAGWQMRVSVSVLLTCLQDDSCCRFCIRYCAEVLSHLVFSVFVSKQEDIPINVWILIHNFYLFAIYSLLCTMCYFSNLSV